MPSYLDGVREIRVLPETPASLGLVLPVDRPVQPTRPAERVRDGVVAAE